MLKGEKSEVEELAEVMQLISKWQSHEPGDVAPLSLPGISAATVPQGSERSPSSTRGQGSMKPGQRTRNGAEKEAWG